MDSIFIPFGAPSRMVAVLKIVTLNTLMGILRMLADYADFHLTWRTTQHI
jgi:hypothetical protein